MSRAVDLSTLPNFFILGAAKAGTTTLYEILRQHPAIHLSFDKEPMFFSRDDYYARGLEWYRKTFFQRAHEHPARGEATPHYLYWAEKVAPRLKQVYGEHPVRFLVVLRNPVQRAHSWYWNMVREGQEPLPFERALAAEADRLRRHWNELESLGSMRFGYFRGGCYATQIQAYLQAFPAECFHFLLLEDLQQDARACMERVRRFLGIEAQFDWQPVERNRAALPRSRPVQELIRERSNIKELIKALLPHSLRHRIKSFLIRANSKEFDYPEIDPEVRRRLADRYTGENASLARLLGRDLSHWN